MQTNLTQNQLNGAGLQWHQLNQNSILKEICAVYLDHYPECCKRVTKKGISYLKLDGFTQLLQCKHRHLATGTHLLGLTPVLGAVQGEMSNMNGRFYLIL